MHLRYRLFGGCSFLLPSDAWLREDGVHVPAPKQPQQWWITMRCLSGSATSGSTTRAKRVKQAAEVKTIAQARFGENPGAASCGIPHRSKTTPHGPVTVRR